MEFKGQSQHLHFIATQHPQMAMTVSFIRRRSKTKEVRPNWSWWCYNPQQINFPHFYLGSWIGQGGLLFGNIFEVKNCPPSQKQSFGGFFLCSRHNFFFDCYHPILSIFVLLSMFMEAFFFVFFAFPAFFACGAEELLWFGQSKYINPQGGCLYCALKKSFYI